MAAPEPPSIVIALNRNIPQRQIVDILLGIEEEGIPHVITTSDEVNPLKLAHEASTASRLGVGVGVSLEFVVVTTEKLAPGRPYIARFRSESRSRDRALGCNAARLVKRIPLRSYDTP